MSYYSEAIARHIVTHTAAEGKEEYQKFFQAALKKFGVSSPAGLSPDKKKDFFNYIEKGYKAKDESTKAFGKAIRKQDLRQQLSMISDKDKATLGKLAALMRGAKKKNPNESLTKEDIDAQIQSLMKRKKDLMAKRPVPHNDVARISGKLNVLRDKKAKQNETLTIEDIATMVREIYLEDKIKISKKEMGKLHKDGGLKKGEHEIEFNEDNDAKIKAIDKQIKQLMKQKEKDMEFMKKLTDLQMRNSQSNKIFRSAKKISDLRKKKASMKENKGLWHNINAKKKRGEKSSPKGSKAYKQAKAAGQKINRKEDVDEIFGPMDRALKQTLKDPKSGKEVTIGSIKNQGEKRYGAALVKKANDIFKKAMEKEKAVKAKTKKMQGESVKNEDVTLPAEIKRYMNKFVSALKGSGLNRRRQLVVLAGVIDALGVDEQMLMKLVRKIKKGMKDVG